MAMAVGRRGRPKSVGTRDDGHRPAVELRHETRRREQPQAEQQCEQHRAQRAGNRRRCPHLDHECPLAGPDFCGKSAVAEGLVAATARFTESGRPAPLAIARYPQEKMR
jgi:hypothetical protein